MTATIKTKSPKYIYLFLITIILGCLYFAFEYVDSTKDIYIDLIDNKSNKELIPEQKKFLDDFNHEVDAFNEIFKSNKTFQQPKNTLLHKHRHYLKLSKATHLELHEEMELCVYKFLFDANSYTYDKKGRYLDYDNTIECIDNILIYILFIEKNPTDFDMLNTYYLLHCKILSTKYNLGNIINTFSTCMKQFIYYDNQNINVILNDETKKAILIRLLSLMQTNLIRLASHYSCGENELSELVNTNIQNPDKKHTLFDVSKLIDILKMVNQNQLNVENGIKLSDEDLIDNRMYIFSNTVILINYINTFVVANKIENEFNESFSKINTKYIEFGKQFFSDELKNE